jgi:hypothetical protein
MGCVLAVADKQPQHMGAQGHLYVDVSGAVDGVGRLASLQTLVGAVGGAPITFDSMNLQQTLDMGSAASMAASTLHASQFAGCCSGLVPALLLQLCCTGS